MKPETITTLNDFRGRILKVRELRAAKADIPPGLEPTDDEIKDALNALRQDRLEQSMKEPKKREKKAPKIDPEMDLMDLFKPKGDPDAP